MESVSFPCRQIHFKIPVLTIEYERSNKKTGKPGAPGEQGPQGPPGRQVMTVVNLKIQRSISFCLTSNVAGSLMRVTAFRPRCRRAPHT